MYKIAFVRHAESTFNSVGDTSPNVPITENGKLSSKSIMGHVDLVICSNMKRARQTLDESKIEYKRVIFTDLCREILDGNKSNLYSSSEDNIVETEEQLQERIRKFKELIYAQPEKSTTRATIAVISHGCFLGKIFNRGFYNCECYISDI